MVMTTAEARDTSIGRALVVLEALGSARTSLGVTTIADRVGMPKSTVHRILGLLISTRYVVKHGDRYLLAERSFELGSRVQVGPRAELRDVAGPHLAELYAATRQTVHLGVLSGTDVLYLDKISAPSTPRLPTQVGLRRPTYATGLGKALVAFASPQDAARQVPAKFRRFTAFTMTDSRKWHTTLSCVRETGVAKDNEESFLGITCLAVPIIDPVRGHAVAAISLSLPVATASRPHYLQRLKGAADDISKALA